MHQNQNQLMKVKGNKQIDKHKDINRTFTWPMRHWPVFNSHKKDNKTAKHYQDPFNIAMVYLN